MIPAAATLNVRISLLLFSKTSVVSDCIYYYYLLCKSLL